VHVPREMVNVLFPQSPFDILVFSDEIARCALKMKSEFLLDATIVSSRDRFARC